MASTRNLGDIFMCGIGFSLILMGGLFCWLMLRSYDRAAAMRHWPQAECLILESTLNTTQMPGDPSPEYRHQVRFRYQWQGRDLESHLLSLRGSPPSAQREKIEKSLHAFPAGEKATCWINPQKPEQAILRLDSQAAGYSLWFPALFIVGGVGIIVGTLRRQGHTHSALQLQQK